MTDVRRPSKVVIKQYAQIFNFIHSRNGIVIYVQVKFTIYFGSWLLIDDHVVFFLHNSAKVCFCEANNQFFAVHILLDSPSCLDCYQPAIKKCRRQIL